MNINLKNVKFNINWLRILFYKKYFIVRYRFEINKNYIKSTKYIKNKYLINPNIFYKIISI